MMLSTFMLYWLLFIYLFFLEIQVKLGQVSTCMLWLCCQQQLCGPLCIFLASFPPSCFSISLLLLFSQQDSRQYVWSLCLGLLDCSSVPFLFFSFLQPFFFCTTVFVKRCEINRRVTKSLRMDLLVNWDQLARFNFNSNQIRFVGVGVLIRGTLSRLSLLVFVLFVLIFTNMKPKKLLNSYGLLWI